MDLEALQREAEAKMEPTAYDYYSGGADDELTLVDNVAAWRRHRLLPHVLRDVSVVDTTTALLGVSMSAPVLVAPTAYHRLADPDGEKATARGAATAGALYVVSTLATVRLEDVAAAAPAASRWFQLYVHKDRQLTEEIVLRAVAAGYEAIVLTVDLTVLGNRRRDEVHSFTLPEGLTMANLAEAVPDVEGSGLGAYAAAAIDPNLTPAVIAWLASISGLPILVKGVLRADDAALAVDAGAAGVVVSNHGGRQLDSALATADALGPVVEAVGDRAAVLVDGGIRGGTDVIKALAMGAAAVLVGRPVLWGLAAGGEEGVAAVLDGFATEIARAMALCGVTAIGQIDKDLLA
ncbi:MAG: alpha-hydroxy-acid oxidizing protein [Acidimicrobiia bacterium]|nr:alpha-hydroxy-acid oxidizing protein [Acidimicrobiia bacterium]